MRLAWFSPWPPQRSGIAGRSAELTSHLAARGHAIDVFVDAREVPTARRSGDEGPQSGAIRVQSAHDFVWRAARGQYDLPVYQLGNSRLHAYIWPYLLRWPGLVVLHDARLHHVRAAALLTAGRDDVYREEFTWSHPDVSPDAAELAVLGFDGTYYYQWPMRRAVVESARLVAAHSRGVVDDLRAEWPHPVAAAVEYVPLGEGAREPIDPSRVMAERAALGLAPDHVLFGVFGALTAERRVPQVLRAFATTVARVANARLVLAGTPTPEVDVARLIRDLGIAASTIVVATPDDQRFDTLIAAADVCINLRWPTALETSGPWIRALAAARATIVTDLAHQAHLPLLDPRTWERHAPIDSTQAVEPIAVSVDLADEEHSLRVAMRRLAGDADLRHRLGASARLHWEAEHTMEAMVERYEELLPQALARPKPTSSMPAALRPDFLNEAAAHLQAFGPAITARLAELGR
jgi:glycosyltransferase involved in cell wall biosynthesis